MRDGQDQTAGNSPSRRELFQAIAGAGIGTAVFHRALAAQVEGRLEVTPEMIEQAEWLSGIEMTEEQRKSTARSVNRVLKDFQAMREVKLENSVPPALSFDPEPWGEKRSEKKGTVTLSKRPVPKKPQSEEDLAFLPVTELAGLIRTKQITSLELTKLYLKRLKKYDPALQCVVTLTEKLALDQAKKMDAEIAAGEYRGPLHGIPWGAKDLIAYPGYPTTWGALPFKEQMIETKATVARKLEEAGAILVAKLSLGALANGDLWFRGKTKNPWNPAQGSSGSSAGSASATAAGLVGFTLGSETLGSIVSPCRRCGTTGLRPTFGRVSRYGCMTLAWSMDKIGPIARSVEDCALILGAICGADGLDGSAVDRPFEWPVKKNLSSLRIGYVKNRRPDGERPELETLRKLGVKLVAIDLPDKLPVGALRHILYTEAATAFDDLTRRGVTEGLNSWPGLFRQGEMVPAVEYLRANRIRTLLMEEMKKVMEKVDAYVGGNDLLITNLTGHPTVVMRQGFYRRGKVQYPYSITFTGQLYGESDLLAIGQAYQEATGQHLKRPLMKKLEKGEGDS